MCSFYKRKLRIYGAENGRMCQIKALFKLKNQDIFQNIDHKNLKV